MAMLKLSKDNSSFFCSFTFYEQTTKNVRNLTWMDLFFFSEKESYRICHILTIFIWRKMYRLDSHATCVIRKKIRTYTGSA